MSLLYVALVCSCLVFAVEGMSGGPAIPDACTTLTPQHIGTSQQEDSTLPTSIVVNGVDGAYMPGAGATLTVTLFSTGDAMFGGFMIQARTATSVEALGTFSILDTTKTKTLQCRESADSASHANAELVQNVTVQWRANVLPAGVDQFRFYYTVVENFTTYWVQAVSEVVPVVPTMTTTPDRPVTTEAAETTPTTVELPSTKRVIPLKEAGVADILVRLHGSMMSFAWGVLAPIGIMLALYYKIVWPNGQWFYTHIAMMLGTLVLSILAIIPILVHANGRWLTTTGSNLPHQVLGIVALTAVGINPFLAICRCYPTSSWRWVYNTIHGSIGLILGQGAAFGAMLLGLHIVRELGGVKMDFVHYAIYSVSSTVGVIIMAAALFNIYSINYMKSHPTAQDLGVTSEPPSRFPERDLSDDDDHDDDEPKDVLCRCSLGLMIVTFLLVGGAVNITLLILL